MMEEDENDPEIKTTITQGHSGKNQILHVHQDSASELDQLFTAALNPSMKSKSLPMKMRKLPKSFFQQPDRPRASIMHAHSKSMGGLVTPSISHSRNSSTDSSASHHSGLNLSSSNLHQQSPMRGNNAMGQRTGNFTPGPVQQHHPFNSPGHVGLQVPQIAHSRSKSLPASLHMMNASMEMKVAQQNSAIEIPPDMPLPQGWEVAKTPDGQTYFMNHANRTTTWVDPRISILKEQQDRANAGNMQATNHPQSPMHISSISNEQTVSPLPPGWEQATTPQGEIYFINHEDRTTSWLDPRHSQNMNLQHANQSQLNAQMQHQLRKMNQLDINPQFNQQRGIQNSQMMVKQLTREKELAMKMRQQEMLKQSGMDPFLGTGSSAAGTFNHPRESDEYLGEAEEMETDGGNHNPQIMSQQQQSCMATVQQQQQRQQQQMHPQRSNSQHQSHFPDFLDTLPASSVDFSNDGGNQQSNALDGEELVPSISETLSPDFINDVESMLNPVVKSENMDNMTWL